jgi:hypothetical protein
VRQPRTSDHECGRRSACLGQMTFIKEQAEKIGAIFGLSMKSSATAS